MSHWAEVNTENIVLRVLTGDNNDPAGDQGYQWLIDNLGGTWIQTSYSGSIRYNYASPGYSYDPVKDAFIPPKPDNAIGFDEETCQWICAPEIADEAKTK